MLLFNNFYYQVNPNIKYIQCDDYSTFHVKNEKKIFKLMNLTAELFKTITNHELFHYDYCQFRADESEIQSTLNNLIELNLVSQQFELLISTTPPTYKMSLSTNLISIKDRYFIINLYHNTSDEIDSKIFDSIQKKAYEILPNEELYRLVSRGYIENISSLSSLKCYANHTQPYKNVYIIFSYDCNLSCSYCFQKGTTHQKSINEVTKNEIIQYIKELTNTVPALITFYGGEPLIDNNFRSIKDVFSEFSRNDYIAYKIITNGVNIPSYFELMKEHKTKIKEIVITFDGNKKDHNLVRTTIDKEETYPTILDSVILLNSYGFPTTLRINLTKSNYSGVHELISDITKNIINQELLTLSLNLITDKPNKNFGEISYLESWNLLNSLKNENSLNIIFNNPYITKLVELDSEDKIYFSPIQEGLCSLKNNIVIDSDGKIYPCNEAMGIEKLVIGDINIPQKQLDYSYTSKISNKDQCQNCSLYLACYGNCFLEQYYDKSCNRNDITNALGDFLLQRYA